MPEPKKIACPECNTPNVLTAPFCENCGYRLRRPGTQREGYDAVTRDQVKDFRSRPRRVAKAPRMQRTPDTKPERDEVQFPDSRTVPEGLPVQDVRRATNFDDSATLLEAPAVTPDEIAAATSDEAPFDDSATLLEAPAVTMEELERAKTLEREKRTKKPKKTNGTATVKARPSSNDGESTMLEGLGRVQAETPVPFADASTVRKHEPIPSYESGTFVLQQEERRMSAAVVFAIWVVSTGALMLLTYYLTSRDQTRTVELRENPTKLEVAAGPFKRGLNEQVRAFIIMNCQKLAEDNDDCEESKLLEGEYPETSVDQPAFKIDSHEVSVDRYQACVAAGKCDAVDYKSCKVYTNQGLQVGLRVPKSLMESNMPVACVTRDEARKFCDFKGGRLPSQDEWEKAARGRKGSLFPWGDTWISDYANWGEVDVIRTSAAGKIDGYEWASPPGSMKDGRSPMGVFDMAGNVAEWVDGDDVEGVARGGSWASNPFDLRTTGRMKLASDVRRADVGFRCAYD